MFSWKSHWAGNRMKATDPDFFENVFEVVRLIPYGRVTSYGAIAKYLGTARSSRMVGWALNNCHRHAHPVPAHRVVNRIGLLSGKHHFETEQQMQQLLESEGVIVEGEQVKDFEKLFWDPMKELL
jgi:methylated-DNA-protein-cysteine methyltransferase-like protein